LVIGTGFAGLGMSIRLLQSGTTDFVVLEQAAAIGGTWRDNTYPGVACDVPSLLYSYSFEAYPFWSRLFAEQREILAYMNHCADKFGVRPHIRFNAQVNRAVFDEKRGRWTITTTAGDQYRARVLVSASGGLSVPSLPDIPGVSRFAGKTFHTARWDHEYPLQGKRVAVIGTGASAIQVVPAIVDQVGELTLFQRTPPWILPKLDLRIGDKQQARFERFPWLQRALRRTIYWMMESRALGLSGRTPRMLRNMEKVAREHLEAQVSDPALRAKLLPSYRIGCKRMLLSNEYYPALTRPNAHVVTEGIQEIREHSIVTKDGVEHEVDAIVFATGFEAAEAVAPFEVRGRAGVDLNDVWREKGAEAYLGTAIAGFPNLFLLVGPNSGLGHNSMVFMIESQIQYVLDSLRQMRERELQTVEVKPSVQARYNARLQERMAKTVWKTGGCISWYNTRDGKNTTLWPGFTFEYRWRTRHFDLQRYIAKPVPSSERLQPAAAPIEQPAPPAE
jgi:cation diffusion facilitator CzcD-associated flavoprotein CzcO